ncbi:MAG TPA: D-alanine--D-alanine ligase [Oligoflexia bacterium]|nr:D-alanine--D-alanine ligase [Oligoflexia bacterium]HMR24527.1 D-alanine--D-alanine ligase [Oligoflexia bacterium]
MKLDQNLKIVVLQGGFSKEREVSLKTAKAIVSALEEGGFKNVATVDVKQGFVKQLLTQDIDVAVNALHGNYGEDGTIQGLLESLDIPYTGAGVEASALCMNKFVSKLLMQYNGVATADYQYIRIEEAFKDIEAKADALGYPLVIKPCHEGSTYGLKVVQKAEDFLDSYEWCKPYGQTFILEKYISGREITVAVLNGKCLPIVEISPKSGFYDYEAKYTPGKTEFACPAQLSSSLQQQAETLAYKSAQILGVLDFCRVDMMLDNDQAFVLEVNTLPGMTPTSLFPRAALAAGMSFFDLLQVLIFQALQRKEKT